MNYEQMIKETDELIRGILLRQQIAECVLFILCAVLLMLLVRLWWKSHKLVKASKAAKIIGGKVFVPVVTDDVQIVNGVEFHRMGTPERM